MSPIYEHRVFAFVDILGFKNMVHTSAFVPQEQARIMKAMEIIHSYKTLNDAGEDGGLRKLGVQVTTFSDSAILSYPIGFNGGLFHSLLDLIHMQMELANIGVFIRGGVTIGLAHHDEHNAFGPAMVEAYRLESEQAVYPRIILTGQTLQAGTALSQSHWNPADMSLMNSVVRQDRDGFYYLDFLRQSQELDSPEDDYYNWLSRIRGYLIYNLNLYYGNASVYPKYLWMLDYWNDVLNLRELSVPVGGEIGEDRARQILNGYEGLRIKPEYPYR